MDDLGTFRSATRRSAWPPLASTNTCRGVCPSWLFLLDLHRVYGLLESLPARHEYIELHRVFARVRFGASSDGTLGDTRPTFHTAGRVARALLAQEQGDVCGGEGGLTRSSLTISACPIAGRGVTVVSALAVAPAALPGCGTRAPPLRRAFAPCPHVCTARMTGWCQGAWRGPSPHHLVIAPTVVRAASASITKTHC